VLAFQYFFPLQARLERRFFKILKKMFLLLLDNPLFTFGLLLASLIILVLSVFTIFLLFGITTILLWWNVALKLRLYKYDHLEKHPDDRRRIPWDALLVEDRERVGKRTLKGMIFPWKE
jgi:Zn-dependent protease with chaperone function